MNILLKILYEERGSKIIMQAQAITEVIASWADSCPITAVGNGSCPRERRLSATMGTQLNTPPETPRTIPPHTIVLRAARGALN